MIIAQHKRRKTKRKKKRKERKGKKKKKKGEEKQENRWHVFRRKKKEGIHTKKVLREFSPPEDPLKTAATYSPTCTQYHRRGEA